MPKQKVLFVCTGNSARSQIAEVLLRHTAGDFFDVYSAGTDPQGVHPETINALEKFGVTASDLRSKNISEFDSWDFDYVISLCDKARQECRIVPSSGKRLEWSFEDPQFRAGPNPFGVTLNEISNRISMFVLIETKEKPKPLELDPIQFFKSLTDEVRLRCLMLVQYEGELCVCEMMAALDEIQPKVSRHLALLKKNDLLVDRRQGQWMYYRINPELPCWAKTVISEATENNVAFIEQSLRRLEAMGDRPQRQLDSCKSSN
ncbi:metalloregulator ArsR/SmtB family transcription factor [Aestuariirhabdus haliotis]|uniref:metalloregulator ArsR/SmtB family transcription factor n=1 Tax=Aestuariirhabdus haliotis TaxID=2918751 RepID=UPI0029E7E649|nr:metalloregulator ArsR/SmtB family transcription factor [Aestuariirhabdus haliotis]